MESTTINNAIKEVREFFMRLEVIFFVKKQRELEKNSTKRKLSATF